MLLNYLIELGAVVILRFIDEHEMLSTACLLEVENEIVTKTFKRSRQDSLKGDFLLNRYLKYFAMETYRSQPFT